MASAAIIDLIGNELVTSDEQTVATPQLPADGALGIYFSAHWCPPCRMFTPELANFYKKFKQTEAGSRLEIVFVSSDQDEDSFKNYLKEMPWPAVPFTDRDRKTKLSKKFQIQGIPTLVFVNPETGKLITKSGREQVSSDPEGKEFPWYPVPLSQLLNVGKLLKKSEEVEAKTALAGKVKGIYFSAHWCPPCRAFTPQLVKTYQKLQEANKNFEIVFVSSDQNKESMESYYSEMPWLAVPYEDPRQDKLSSYFEVDGIPTLVILDENDEIITKEGTSAVGRDQEGEKFPWIPPPCEVLDKGAGRSIQESASLILFTDKNEELVNQAVSQLTDIGSKYLVDQKASLVADDQLPELKFFYEGNESEAMTNSLKQFLQQATGSEEPLSKCRVLIMDIPGQRFYALDWPDTSNDPLAADPTLLANIVEKFKKNELEWKDF